MAESMEEREAEMSGRGHGFVDPGFAAAPFPF